MMNFFNWLLANYDQLLIAIVGLVGSLEVIFRFLPTKTPASFLERLGSIIRSVMDFLKIPNLSK